MAVYLFRQGDGNEGNYPRCLFELDDSDDLHAALAAIVINMWIQGPYRDHAIEHIQIDGDDQSVYATIYEGPNGQTPFDAAWATAELAHLDPNDLDYYHSKLNKYTLADELDQAAMDYYYRVKK